VIVKEIWMMRMEIFVQLEEVVAVAEGAVEVEGVEEAAGDGAQDSPTGA